MAYGWLRAPLVPFCKSDTLINGDARPPLGVGERSRCKKWACVRVHARVLVPPNLYIHTYIQKMNEDGGDTCSVALACDWRLVDVHKSL